MNIVFPDEVIVRLFSGVCR